MNIKVLTLLWVGISLGALPVWAQPTIDLKFIPGGYFSMGDHYGEGNSNELPVHPVYVSDFEMGTYEVSKAEWDEVRNWALSNGYIGTPEGQAGSYSSRQDSSHPVTMISWDDAVQWCNALSEWSGLDPVYYREDNNTIYRTGEHHNIVMDVTKNGYRLPTEAEWEKAARGGLVAHYYPWPSSGRYDESYSDHIAPGLAVYADNSGGTVSASDKSYKANGYGLYHMCGNVSEWVWDFYEAYWYSGDAASAADPEGPSTGITRVFRGGSWSYDASSCRVAFRGNSNSEDDTNNRLGFRVSRSVIE